MCIEKRFDTPGITIILWTITYIEGTEVYTLHIHQWSVLCGWRWLLLSVNISAIVVKVSIVLEHVFSGSLHQCRIISSIGEHWWHEDNEVLFTFKEVIYMFVVTAWWPTARGWVTLGPEMRSVRASLPQAVGVCWEQGNHHCVAQEETVSQRPTNSCKYMLVRKLSTCIQFFVTTIFCTTICHKKVLPLGFLLFRHCYNIIWVL